MTETGAVGGENDSPIIGVLTQEYIFSIDDILNRANTSYIPASYVKFVEGGGARVVPIWIGQDRQYYADIVNKTNGLLLPGGAVTFNKKNGYIAAAKILYEEAVKQNNNGVHYPIFGICLGMEFLVYVLTENMKFRTFCHAQNIALPLQFKSDFKDSQLFRNASDDVIHALATQNITAHYHIFCVTEQNLKDFNLEDHIRVLALGRDRYGLEFISCLESRKYPFFGVQFHPEKPIYEWKPRTGTSHTKEAIQAGQYLTQTFVNEARKNFNSYGSQEEERKVLIYNYPALYTRHSTKIYEQCYVFKNKTSNNL